MRQGGALDSKDTTERVQLGDYEHEEVVIHVNNDALVRRQDARQGQFQRRHMIVPCIVCITRKPWWLRAQAVRRITLTTDCQVALLDFTGVFPATASIPG